ncbi:alpha/beta hydrolase [Mycolicibacter sp. MYC017]|uniref:Alpha/beta hydrolase n=1 Tax=[Mycobacterium] vasticus TaxID=2875777 RepID=A0ABU5YYP5_9MYCO|nr:alpha/beta hydrolase [Mycolicibacter sp. MYC017]MEB3070270.1 alpha/beta hydrolase [Mycolicibacter sp. MYC017]
MVHGGSAHSGWWDHIAPLLAGSYRVVALDLTGHGDSDRRPRYGLTAWAAEVLGAAAAAGISGKPTVIGHSMGGWVTATTALHFGDQLAGIVIIDSTLRDEPDERSRFRGRGRASVYESRETILSRFTTVPEQAVLLPYIAEHVAAESIRQTDDGWQWKFDPALFDDSFFDEGWPEELTLADHLPHISGRVAFLRAEQGLVPVTMREEVKALLGHRGPVVDLPDTGHHPMLDQPLSLVTALRTVLAQWEITPPQ